MLAFQNLLRNHLSGSFSPSRAPEVNVQSPGNGQCVFLKRVPLSLPRGLCLSALASLMDEYSQESSNNSQPAIVRTSLVRASMSTPRGCLWGSWSCHCQGTGTGYWNYWAQSLFWSLGLHCWHLGSHLPLSWEDLLQLLTPVPKFLNSLDPTKTYTSLQEQTTVFLHKDASIHS